MAQSARVLLALVVGLVLGTLVQSSGSDLLYSIVQGIQPLGTMWTNAIRMTVIPLVVALIINGVAGSTDVARIGQLGKRILPIFLVLLLAGAALSVVLATPAMSALEIPPDVAERLRAGAATDNVTQSQTVPTVMQRIVEIVPVNPIRAAADGAMLPLVVFALLFAIALTRLPEVKREPIVTFFRALGDAMMVLVRWVLALAPIGIFALALGLGMNMGASAAGALVYYMAVLSGVLVVYTLLLYPAVRIICGVSFKRFFAAAAPAQGIALSSRSSLAALPAIVTGARDHLGSPAPVTGFALPLAVSVFRVNVPMAWVVGVLFLGKLYGADIGLPDLLQVVLLSTFLSFSVPGIPSASLFLLAPLLPGLGIPAVGAGVLIAVDAIPDMFKTTANVTSHVAVAAMLGGVPENDPTRPPAGARAAEAA